MPSEKFAAASTPMPASSAIARIAASCACHPVVPITTLILRAASCGRLPGTASASVKSIATSTSPNCPSAIARSPECSSITPAIVAPYSGASDSTSWPIRPWPSSRMRISAHACRYGREELLVDAAERRRQIRFADHERDVPPRRRLRHHPQRHVADRGQHLRGQARIVLQAVADDAHDRHLILALDLRELRQAFDDRRQPPRIVDRHRHADLRGRDDVHRGLVALEHFEQPAQEAVRHQHPRRRDVDDGDGLLRRHRGQRPVGLRPLGGDQRAARGGAMRVEDAHRECCAPPPAESSPDAAPSRRSTPAPTLRRTTGAARPADS